MKNERHPQPRPENEGARSQSFEIHFDDGHFGDTKRAVGTLELVAELNEWWDNICTANKLNPRDEELEAVGYHIIELGKNALEHTGGGQIQVILEPNQIIVIVSDDRGWDGDPNDDLLYGSPEHGLSGVKSYADGFIIETNGTKYTKVPGEESLAKTEDTVVKQGTKITFIKSFNNTLPK